MPPNVVIDIVPSFVIFVDAEARTNSSARTLSFMRSASAILSGGDDRRQSAPGAPACHLAIGINHYPEGIDSKGALADERSIADAFEAYSLATMNTVLSFRLR